MTLEHFRLRLAPFEAAPDSRFYFPLPACDEALALMHYVVRNAGECALITGPPGCGKTLLLRTLRRQLPREQFVVVFVPAAVGGDLPRCVTRFLPSSGQADSDPHGALRCLAHTCARQNQTLVFLLDGYGETCGADSGPLAALLNPDVDNLRTSVVLTARGEPRQRDELLLGVARVGPLERARVADYLAHRLRVAGHPTGELFEPEAAERIAEHSAGVPRAIHRLANLAMHVAALAAAERVGPHHVGQALERLARLVGPAGATVEAAR